MARFHLGKEKKKPADEPTYGSRAIAKRLFEMELASQARKFGMNIEKIAQIKTVQKRGESKEEYIARKNQDRASTKVMIENHSLDDMIENGPR